MWSVIIKMVWVLVYLLESLNIRIVETEVSIKRRSRDHQTFINTCSNFLGRLYLRFFLKLRHCYARIQNLLMSRWNIDAWYGMRLRTLCYLGKSLDLWRYLRVLDISCTFAGRFFETGANWKIWGRFLFIWALDLIFFVFRLNCGLNLFLWHFKISLFVLLDKNFLFCGLMDWL